MAQKNIRGIRAAFQDAQAILAASEETLDPPADVARGEWEPGSWPGAPADRLPPDCPVVPLGVDGKITYVVDSLGQLIAISAAEWSKKMLVQLFARQPNYLYWAWPRWGAPKSGQKSKINGLEVDDAIQCLMKAAARRGLFSPIDRVRGRGAWTTKSGALIWHAGNAIYTVEQGRLKAARAGEIDGVFYPQRPPVPAPWSEPVDASDSPAQDILRHLKTWTLERRHLDPLLIRGWIGCAFLGAALPWRPVLFTTGDRGVGKSTLHGLIKGILGSAMHACADTTAAGIYQRVKQDSLPVAVDELEAGADNRRVMAVVGLARLASSGALMYRGGAEHEGVEFRLQNSFFFSSINPPPLEPQDKSRMALINMGRLSGKQTEMPVISEDQGRMILRALMDAWPRFAGLLAYWREALKLGGLDARGQDTFGTLLTVANLLLGDAVMDDAGLPIDDQRQIGEVIARATANERAESSENWRGCLERLLGSTIEAWKSGEKPTIGHVLELWETNQEAEKWANERLQLVGLRVREERDASDAIRARHLCVPVSTNMQGIQRLYAETKWKDGVWAGALKQAPDDVVIRNRGNGQNVKISRVTQRCLLVDLAAYDRHVKEEG